MQTTVGRMAAVLGAVFCVSAGAAHAGAVDELIERLKDKGILSGDEYEKLKQERAGEKKAAEAAPAPAAPAPAAGAEKSVADKIKIGDQIKSVELFGDLRLRGEDRIAKSVTNATYDQWRNRYAFRLGLRGDVGDHWFYGLRLETSDNPRSSWVTFGNDTNNGGNSGQAGKLSDHVNIGQVYAGWKPTDWATVVVGRQPNPLMTTPMVWDPDIAPEGLSEKFTWKANDNLTLFGTLGQFVYQDVAVDSTTSNNLAIRKQDLWLYAFEAGAEYKFSPDTAIKAAINSYKYTGGQRGVTNVLTPFTGEPATPPGGTGANTITGQIGVNNLKIIEVPVELRFPVADYSGLFYGNFARNSDADERARIAGKPAYGNQDKAFQVGLALGSHGMALGATRGLTYGSSAKKNSWEVRTYWQRTEQYALDPNMVDSDFFERTNMQGYFLAGAYAPTDGVITTMRLGHAKRYNDNLGTGGFNSDSSVVQPITEYNILQFDLTVRF